MRLMYIEHKINGIINLLKLFDIIYKSVKTASQCQFINFKF